MSSSKKLLQAAAGNAGGDNLYVEDVFSTYLYTGNASTQTITNGIDLAGEGGLVWTKNRTNAYDNYLYDTARGVNKVLLSNNTIDEQSLANTLTAFNSNGFTLGGSDYGNITPGAAAVSWTFRKAEKFFDVVTYTGTGTVQNIAHALGSKPACMLIKRTDSAQNWWVYHEGVDVSPASYYLALNLTDARTASGVLWNSTEPTDSVFTIDSSANISSATYVAYLFASDAGGFGDDGSENIIKCGSYTSTGNSVTGIDIDLGFEPQWILQKNATGTSSTYWMIADVMRGLTAKNGTSYPSVKVLKPNTSAAEADPGILSINSTGFTSHGGFNSGDNIVYIAIRRPMKTPESGTEVFAADFRGSTQATAAGVVSYSGFPVDLAIQLERASDASTGSFVDRLRNKQWLFTINTAAETPVIGDFDTMHGWWNGTTGSNTTIVALMFKRATGFFDVVAYTGDGIAGSTQAHNLGVAPEMMIVKNRNSAFYGWSVYHSATGNTKRLEIDTTGGANSVISWNNTTPTETVFTLGDENGVNRSAYTYIAYLFATLAGVSKVGSYTGTGADLNVDCGFSAGARFILIKRTDSTGGWYVWDSERGIAAGNDPYLLLNSPAAEVTNTDYVDPLNAGFTVTSSASSTVNVSSGSYIFLAIA